MKWYRPFEIAMELMNYDRFGALRMATYTVSMLCTFSMACGHFLAGNRGLALCWLLGSVAFCMFSIVGWFLLGAQCLLRYDRMRDERKEEA